MSVAARNSAIAAVDTDFDMRSVHITGSVADAAPDRSGKRQTIIA